MQLLANLSEIIRQSIVIDRLPVSSSIEFTPQQESPASRRCAKEY